MNKSVDKSETSLRHRTLRGVVVSDKMDKTVVVEVSTLKTHAKYKKKYKSSAKYKAHDEENACHSGQVVTIEETRPLSKDKHWRVVETN